MATLVNRKCWLFTCMLRDGKVVSQKFNPDICEVDTTNGHYENTLTLSRNIILTKEEVISECEEAIVYLKQKIKELEEID